MLVKLRPSRAAVLALCACMVASSAAAHAEEEVVNVRPGGSITAASNGKVTFSTEVGSVACNVTLTGSLETEDVDIERFPVGSVSALRWASCAGGELTTALGLPWSLVYTSALGTLPEAATGFDLTIEEAAMLFTAFGVSCLYRGNVEALLPVSGGNPYRAERIRASARGLTLVSGSFCGTAASLSGEFTLSAAQELSLQATRVTFAPKLWTFGGAADKTFTVTATQNVLTLTKAFRGAPPEYTLSMDGCGNAIQVGTPCSVTVRKTVGPRDTALLFMEAGKLIGGASLMH
jgi:hypothetical protein